MTPLTDAELDGLQKRLLDGEPGLGRTKSMAEASYAIQDLRIERDALRKDAERYRWLRRYADDSPEQRLRVWEGPPWDQSATVWWQESLDNAIDAAMKGGGE